VSIFDRKYLLGGQQGAQATADLNFLTGTLDPRITFSRADATANASYTDSTGVLRYGPNNLMFPSGDVSGWGTQFATLTAASGIAPDGSNTMTRIAETAVTNVHYANKTATIAAGATCTYSIYAQAATEPLPAADLCDDNSARTAPLLRLTSSVATITGALDSARHWHCRRRIDPICRQRDSIAAASPLSAPRQQHARSAGCPIATLPRQPLCPQLRRQRRERACSSGARSWKRKQRARPLRRDDGRRRCPGRALTTRPATVTNWIRNSTMVGASPPAT
jgi:hypothetical protein